jgi:hypothetical protein
VPKKSYPTPALQLQVPSLSFYIFYIDKTSTNSTLSGPPHSPAFRKIRYQVQFLYISPKWDKNSTIAKSPYKRPCAP